MRQTIWRLALWRKHARLTRCASVRILLVTASNLHSGNEVTMELLVLVIDHGERLDSILSGFVELGVTGATIIESRGMARRLSEGNAATPVFAGLQELLAASRPQSTTVFSVIETQEKLDAAITMIRDKCGDLTEPGTGILFTVPVNRAVGLATALGAEPS